MKKVYIYIIMCLLPLALAAQKKENSNSAISRNLELFNDIYKQLDLFYVDSLNGLCYWERHTFDVATDRPIHRLLSGG